MIRALAVIFLCSVAWAEHASLETSAPRATYYVHEPIRLTLRIRVDTEFFESNAVQMFQRDFDVPVQVRAPWLDKLDGAVLSAIPADADTSLVLNGSDALARRSTDGRYTVLEIERTYLPTRTGEFVLPAPELRYVYGTEFREDFLDGRVAVDKRDAYAHGKPLKLTVRALPPAPGGFGGAVGQFTVSADATPREIEAGAIVKLTLRIEGDGNLGLIEMPRLDGLEGFHVYGAVDDEGVLRRTIVYDIAPLTATAIPSIPFTYFDPRDGAYRTATTAPIPLTVRGIEVPIPVPEPEPRSYWVWAAPLAAVLALLLLVRRRRPRDVVDVRAVFRARAATDVTAALTEYLAVRLGCPTAAVITPDLAARLAKAGVPAGLAARTAAEVEALVGGRYGGAAPAPAVAEGLVDELERTR